MAALCAGRCLSSKQGLQAMNHMKSHSGSHDGRRRRVREKCSRLELDNENPDAAQRSRTGLDFLTKRQQARKNKKGGGFTSTALKIKPSNEGLPQSMQSVVCQNQAKIATRLAMAKADRMIDCRGWPKLAKSTRMEPIRELVTIAKTQLMRFEPVLKP